MYYCIWFSIHDLKKFIAGIVDWIICYEVMFILIDKLKLFKLTIKLFTFNHFLSFTKHIILGAVGRMHVFLHDHYYIDHNQMLFL